MRIVEVKTSSMLKKELLDCLERNYLPDEFLYLDRDSRNWTELNASDDFPVARDLTDLLEKYSVELMSRVGGGLNLLSLGAGEGQKERIILKSWPKGYLPRYFCVDISRGLVETALANVSELGLEMTGLIGSIRELDLLARLIEKPVLLAMLGNNFCNFEPDVLLSDLWKFLGSEGRIVIDAHLFEGDINSTARAYLSARNKIFNLGPLIEAGLEPEQAQFNVELIRAATQIGDVFRTKKTIKFLSGVSLDFGGRIIRFEKGQIINMGFTYKYRFEQLTELLGRGGFVIDFSVNLDYNALILARKGNDD